MSVQQSSSGASGERPRVAIVGGGLAGLATAVALSQTDASVSLFESRKRFGGRATSFRDPDTGQSIDFCQHVSMQCCTNLADLIHRVGLTDSFVPARTLSFIAPDGRQCDFGASAWLPAPLHLAPGLRKLVYLTAGDRRSIARAMWRLMRTPLVDSPQTPTARQWLAAQGQSERAIEWFWGVVLVSALGESLERASMAAARKVFVDGFLASREAYVVQTPQAPLGELFGRRLPQWLERQGVALEAEAPIHQLDREADGRFVLDGQGGPRKAFDRVVVAIPWRYFGSLLPDDWRERLPWIEHLDRWPASPITGVHLWFDRPITELKQAVLVGRLGQWLFNRTSEPHRSVTSDPATSDAATSDSPTSDAVTSERGSSETGSSNLASPEATSSDAPQPGEFYYQVVISASRDLTGREQLIQDLCEELRAIWPAAREARLVRHRVVTEQMAVFSVAPGCSRWRPAQRTAIDGLFVAGDWTATGWPATMEGAVRSGYLAAEAVAASLGQPRRFLAPDLKRSWVAKLLIK